MQGKLTIAQRNYVLYHLSLLFDIPESIGQLFLFQSSVVEGQAKSIVFIESGYPYKEDNVVRIEEIPILFPVFNGKAVYELDLHGNLIFNHDLIKSAFYLLSGYQEYIGTQSKDNLGRFSYSDSVQCKLNCIDKPVVNYYFHWIVSGLQTYCKFHGIPSLIRPRVDNFSFLLSHDVDSVDLYTFEYWVYKIKEITGLKPSTLSKWTDIRLGITGFLKWIGLIKRDNPYWNFEFLRSLERQYNFRSTFYFLDQGVKHDDAYYGFDEERILRLFDFVKAENCEIGLHGSSRSCNNVDVMTSNLNRLRLFSKTTIVGNRQHRLLWKHPETAKVLNQVGLQYDTTLGFAAHEGFRNSYCHPFRLYDFESEKMLDVWEFPLVVMDVTLFAYQKYSMDIAKQKCLELLTESKKFNGLFTLLWHNSFFDDVKYPGVSEFYADLLQIIASHRPNNVLANELLKSLNKR